MKLTIGSFTWYLLLIGQLHWVCEPENHRTRLEISALLLYLTLVMFLEPASRVLMKFLIDPSKISRPYLAMQFRARAIKVSRLSYGERCRLEWCRYGRWYIRFIIDLGTNHAPWSFNATILLAKNIIMGCFAIRFIGCCLLFCAELTSSSVDVEKKRQVLPSSHASTMQEVPKIVYLCSG